MKLKTLVAGIAMAMVAPLAIAGDSGFYVDASVGRMTATMPTIPLAGATNNDSDTTFAIGGGYKFNEYFGVEAGYQDLGEVSASWTGAGTVNIQGHVIVGTGALNYTASVDGFYFGPTFSFPVNEQFSINARAGLYRWEAKENALFTAAGTIDGTAFAAGASASATTKETDNYLGLGATYKVSKNVGINLNYTEYKISDYRAKNFAVGAKYAF